MGAGPQRERCTSTSPVCNQRRHHFRTVFVVHLTNAAVATTLPLVRSMRATILMRRSLGRAAPLLYHHPHELHAAVASAQARQRPRMARSSPKCRIGRAQSGQEAAARGCCDCQADLL